MSSLLRSRALAAVPTVLLLAAFHLLPWLRWDGHQAVLLDLAERRFDLFGLTLWPGQPALLLGLLAVLAVMLALLTHLAGRVWCGHACPQTLWSALFGWVERCTRRWLGAATCEPWIRHLLWALIALWTGLTFVGLFTPIEDLLARTLDGHLRVWEAFWMLFYAAATFGNAAYLRQRVCQTFCPFARIQTQFCDGHTPRMLYVAPRGEPRGPRPRGLGSVAQRGRGLLDRTTAQDYVFRAAHPQLAGPMPHFAADRLGDCTDCGDCVRVCPAHLDIRNGPQAACLACGACLVACRSAQHAAGFDQGLIRYISPERLSRRPARLLRPRTLGLLGLLCLVGGLLLLGDALAG